MSILLFGFFTSCDDITPTKEDDRELITKVILTFTPTGGGDPIVVSATDPDGEGLQDLAADGAIELDADETYTLSIGMLNELADVTDPGYNVTEEVEEEADEHLFLFAWTNSVFASPSGNGNADNRTDPVNYLDEDDNGLPLGLSTSWTTISSSGEGTFTILLKHQPGVKTSTSGADTGETDLDVMFDISIE